MSGRSCTTIAYLAAASLLVACSSTGASVPKGKEYRVSFSDLESGVQFTLVNEGNSGYRDLYSRPGSDGSVKLISDEAMESIVDFAGDAGFFEYARPSMLLTDNSKRILAIAVDDRIHTFVLERGMGTRDRESVRVFTEVQEHARQVFNNTFAAQYIRSGDGAIFDREKQRVSELNRSRDGASRAESDGR